MYHFGLKQVYWEPKATIPRLPREIFWRSQLVMVALLDHSLALSEDNNKFDHAGGLSLVHLHGHQNEPNYFVNQWTVNIDEFTSTFAA